MALGISLDKSHFLRQHEIGDIECIEKTKGLDRFWRFSDITRQENGFRASQPNHNCRTARACLSLGVERPGCTQPPLEPPLYLHQADFGSTKDSRESFLGGQFSPHDCLLGKRADVVARWDRCTTVFTHVGSVRTDLAPTADDGDRG